MTVPVVTWTAIPMWRHPVAVSQGPPSAVLDNGHIVGMVTQTDVIAALHRDP